MCINKLLVVNDGFFSTYEIVRVIRTYRKDINNTLLMHILSFSFFLHSGKYTPLYLDNSHLHSLLDRLPSSLLQGNIRVDNHREQVKRRNHVSVHAHLVPFHSIHCFYRIQF